MKKALLLFLFFLSACATVKPMYMKDGVMVYKATCNGIARDIGDCYVLASEQCAGNFEVVDTVENQYDDLFKTNKDKVKETTYENGKKIEKTKYDPFDTFDTPMVKRSMFFYCK
ncbi:MAG: hypothetical protein E7019_05905 [Alphaproteobacteria bacterium]|nr:hypothetical protein [Alphaproteobacteria bacterium]